MGVPFLPEKTLDFEITRMYFNIGSCVKKE